MLSFGMPPGVDELQPAKWIDAGPAGIIALSLIIVVGMMLWSFSRFYSKLIDIHSSAQSAEREMHIAERRGHETEMREITNGIGRIVDSHQKANDAHVQALHNITSELVNVRHVIDKRRAGNE